MSISGEEEDHGALELSAVAKNEVEVNATADASNAGDGNGNDENNSDNKNNGSEKNDTNGDNPTTDTTEDNDNSTPSPDLPPSSEVSASKKDLTDAERIELELTTSCAIMFQCAWRCRVAVKKTTAIALDIIEKIYDPRTETYYYYNKRLDKSRWEVPLYFKLAKGGEKLLEVSPTYTDLQATMMIQTCLRRRIARKVIRKLLVETTDKVYDENTNQYYYFNRTSGETSWEKPKIWGMEDVEDYDGTRERERKRALSLSRKDSKRGSRRGTRRGSTRGSVRSEAEFSEYRPMTADSGWTGDTKTEYSETEGAETERTGFTGTDVDEGEEDDIGETDDVQEYKDSDEEKERGDDEDESGDGKSDDDFDSSDADGDDDGDDSDARKSDAVSLAPRRYPRSKMQLLIDQAEDENFGQPALGAKPEYDVDAVAPSPLPDEDEFQEEKKDGKDGTLGGDQDDEADQGIKPKSLTLNLSHLAAPRVSGRIYDLEESLTALDLSHNKLTRISPDMGELRRLVTLNISHNRISKLPAELDDLQSLQILDMSHNKLIEYPATLYKLKLSEWDVSYNKLTEIPVSVGDLDLLKETKEWEVGLGLLAKTLKTYRCGGNKLSKFPAQLERCSLIQEIDIHRNQIDSLPDDCKHLVHLEKLLVSSNEFTSLPDFINDFKKLKVLDVSNNLIATLPTNLDNFTRLTHLLLDDNQMDELPDSLRNCVSMTVLSCARNNIARITSESTNWVDLVEVNFDDNQLTELPDHINKWNKLTRVTCQNNQISKLPSGFNQLFKIAEINFQRNKIGSFVGKEFGMLMSVVSCDFSHNELVELPFDFFRMAHLEVLKLNNNKLSVLPMSVSKFQKLISLNLSSNELVEIPLAVGKLKQLVDLDVSNNKLSHLPEELSELDHLEQVNICSNCFEDKPEVFDEMICVKSFNMSGNPFYERRKRVQHMDATLKLGAVADRILFEESVDTLEKLIENVGSAEAAVKAYDLQKANYAMMIREAEIALGVSKDDDKPLYPDDSSSPPPPPSTHVHHFRLGVMHMRVGRHFLKQVEKICNGGKTDEELREEKERLDADAEAKKDKAGDLLKNVMGGGGWKKKQQNEDDDNDTVQTNESHMDRERRKEQEKAAKIKPYRKQAEEWLRKAIMAFNLAEELCVRARILGKGAEIYYNRACCFFELKDSAGCIKDLDKSVKLQPTNIPALLLRARARVLLGQYPQGRRDCMKVLNRFDPENKEAEELKEECEESTKGLIKSGVCSDELERTFEVHGDGVLTRDRVEVRKLDQIGRSKARARLDRMKKKKEVKKELMKKHDEERVAEVEAAHRRAELAKRKMAFAKKKRLECIEARMKIEKLQREEMAKKQAEKAKRIERAKEEQENELMGKEEDLMREYERFAVKDITAEDEKFEQENEDEMEALLAAAGRGGRKNKKKAGNEDKPWLVKGKKKKAGKKKIVQKVVVEGKP